MSFDVSRSLAGSSPPFTRSQAFQRPRKELCSRNERAYFYLADSEPLVRKNSLGNVGILAPPFGLQGFPRHERLYLSADLWQHLHIVRIYPHPSVVSCLLYGTISPVNGPNRNTVSIPISIIPTSASLIAASLFIAIHPLDKSIGPRATAPAPPPAFFLSLTLYSSPPPPLSLSLSRSFAVSSPVPF